MEPIAKFPSEVPSYLINIALELLCEFFTLLSRFGLTILNPPALLEPPGQEETSYKNNRRRCPASKNNHETTNKNSGSPVPGPVPGLFRIEYRIHANTAVSGQFTDEVQFGFNFSCDIQQFELTFLLNFLSKLFCFSFYSLSLD